MNGQCAACLFLSSRVLFPTSHVSCSEAQRPKGAIGDFGPMAPLALGYPEPRVSAPLGSEKRPMSLGQGCHRCGIADSTLTRAHLASLGSAHPWLWVTQSQGCHRAGIADGTLRALGLRTGDMRSRELYMRSQEPHLGCRQINEYSLPTPYHGTEPRWEHTGVRRLHADTGRALVFPLNSAPEAKPMHRQLRARLEGK